MTTLNRVAPGGGARAIFWQLWAVLRAETLMQWRRWGFWVTLAAFCAMMLLLTAEGAFYFTHLPPGSLYVREHFTSDQFENAIVYNATGYGVMVFGLLAALLVVDRPERDLRLGMVELQRATPQGYGSYALGKVAGNYLATLAPALMTYLLCALLAMLLGWPLAIAIKTLLAFALVLAPSSLAAISVALALATVLPVRIAQIGFSVLWIFVSIGIGWRGLTNSLFNTSGLYVYPVILPLPLPSVPGTPTTSPALAQLNIEVLLLAAATALGLLYGALVAQRLRAEVA